MDHSASPPRAVNVPAGRLARITRLGSMASGVAGNMALSGIGEIARGRRPGFQDLLLTPNNVRRIADDLARMRGAAMKIGQLISMDTGDILPPELADVMARLRADADYMPPKQLRSVLNRNWGPDWLRHFKNFDVTPIAAASIGQVHRARTKDGRDMAIKVQYPGVARSIDSDVSNVGALIKVSGLVPRGFEIDPYLDEARRQLHSEADYEREGGCMAEFRNLLADQDDFTLPELYEDFTTKHVLAMSYVPSRPIEEAEALDQETRNRIAERMIILLCRELFEFGQMQTDPNFANYRYEPETGRIVLLDFGATRHFDDALIGQYRRLFRAGLAHDLVALREVAIEIGFVGPETAERHQAAVLGMIAMVFEAVREGEIFDFGDRALSHRMNEAGAALAEDGYVPPPIPIDALFLQRKFAGVFLLCNKLKARLPLQDLLDRWTA
ncbi:MAG: AarF/ABC1/UbiB kinase family protein [Pseudomonadota bacterium]